MAAPGTSRTSTRLKMVSRRRSPGGRASSDPVGVEPEDARATMPSRTSTAAAVRTSGKRLAPLLMWCLGGRSGCGRSRRGPALPVAVQRSLDLHEPDDRRDDQDCSWDQPEAGPAGHGLRLARLRVHVPELGGDDERAHRVDQDPDDEAEDAPESVAGVLLHLLLGLLGPLPPVDAEGDDEEQDAEADPAGLAQRARACRWGGRFPPPLSPPFACLPPRPPPP